MDDVRRFWNDLQDHEYAHEYADEMLNIFIATQLRVLRGERSQQEIARIANMKQERISVLENVNYGSWSVSTLRRLARAFDVRLKISFESFGTLLDDLKNLDPEALRRTTRVEECETALRELDAVPETLKQAVQPPKSAQHSSTERQAAFSAANAIPEQSVFIGLHRSRHVLPASNIPTGALAAFSEQASPGRQRRRQGAAA